MDIREHSVALLSVVIGLGLTSLLGNFNRLMRRRGEIRWVALPLLWALIVLMLVNNYWWVVYLGMVTSTTAANVGDFVADVVNPAEGIAFKKTGNRRVVAERRDELHPRIGQINEDCGDTVLRLRDRL